MWFVSKHFYDFCKTRRNKDCWNQNAVVRCSWRVCVSLLLKTSVQSVIWADLLTSSPSWGGVSLTYAAPPPPPPWRAGARVRSHAFSSVHARGLTHTWNRLKWAVFLFLWASLQTGGPYSSDTSVPRSLRDTSTRCSSCTDRRSYREGCKQLNHRNQFTSEMRQESSWVFRWGGRVTDLTLRAVETAGTRTDARL